MPLGEGLGDGVAARAGRQPRLRLPGRAAGRRSASACAPIRAASRRCSSTAAGRYPRAGRRAVVARSQRATTCWSSPRRRRAVRRGSGRRSSVPRRPAPDRRRKRRGASWRSPPASPRPSRESPAPTTCRSTGSACARAESARSDESGYESGEEESYGTTDEGEWNEESEWGDGSDAAMARDDGE